MKSLLTTISLFEAGTGIALILVPATVVSLLLGISFDEPELHIISAITGAALLSLGLACWLFRNISPYGGLLIKALLIYNIVACLVLIYGFFGLNLSAIGLWPAILIHALLSMWSFMVLRRSN